MLGFWCICGVVLLVSIVNGAPKPQEVDSSSSSPELPPAEVSSSPTPPLLPNGEPAVPECQNTTDVYDLSQNGSENYKVNVKGFTFLLAGSDTVLGAAMLMSGMADDKNNPALPVSSQTNPPTVAESSPDKMSRLMHLIKQISQGGRSINVNLLNNQEGDKQIKTYLRNVQ